MPDAKFYNLLARLYDEINDKIGKTEFKSIIFDQIDDKVDTHKKSILYQQCENDIECKNVNKDRASIYFKYMKLIDYETGTVCQNNSTISLDSPLNDDYIDVVEIYGTYNSIHHNRMSNDNFNCLFPHLVFFYKKKEFQKKYKLNNYYYDNDKDEIIITYIPYPLYNQGDNITPSGKKFSCIKKESYTTNDELYLERINYALKNEESDLIFGPEIDGSELLNQKILNVVKEFKNKFVSCPSYHVLKGNEIYNLSTLICNNDIIPNIIEIYKNFPAEFTEGKKKENINGKYELTLLHIRKIGKILILICKDYITTDINCFIEELNIDIVIVIACTKKTEAFQSKIDSLRINKQYTIMGNSCSVFYEENEKGPVFIYSNKNKINTKKCNFSKEDCLNIKDCMFSLRISSKQDKYNNSCLEIVELKGALQK